MNTDILLGKSLENVDKPDVILNYASVYDLTCAMIIKLINLYTDKETYNEHQLLHDKKIFANLYTHYCSLCKFHDYMIEHEDNDIGKLFRKRLTVHKHEPIEFSCKLNTLYIQIISKYFVERFNYVVHELFDINKEHLKYNGFIYKVMKLSDIDFKNMIGNNEHKYNACIKLITFRYIFDGDFYISTVDTFAKYRKEKHLNELHKEITRQYIKDNLNTKDYDAMIKKIHDIRNN